MDDVVLFDLSQLQKIMDHRSISLGDVAENLGCSVRWLRLVFKGEVASPTNLISWIDKVDDAVTKITDERGGIPFACCGLGPYGAMVNVIRRETLNG